MSGFGQDSTNHAAYLPHEVIAGSPWDRGFSLGSRHREALHEFLSDNLARINILRSAPLAFDDARRKAMCFAEIIERDVPDIAEELHGFAQGADIDYADAVLLQCRRELIDVPTEDCSAWAEARVEGRTPCLAQSVDLPGDMTELGMVLEVVLPGGRPKALMFTHLGLLGYMGINSAGIAIGINMVRGGTWRAGVPPYLLVRHLLSLQDLDECIEAIARIERASSRSLLLLQGQRLLNVEMTPTEHRVTEGHVLLHTNHYLHPDFAHHNAEPMRYGSTERFERLLEFSASRSIRVDNPTWLADHGEGKSPICFHPKSRRDPATIAAVVLQPDRGELRACRGRPCESPFFAYSFGNGAHHVN